MKERNIETTLKDLQAPAPDPQARLRAKRAALAEFARVSAESLDIKLPDETDFKASEPAPRLSRDESPHGRALMKWFNNRKYLAAAAGVGVLAIGLAWVLPNVDRYSGELAQPELASTKLPESPTASTGAGLLGEAKPADAAGAAAIVPAPVAENSRVDMQRKAKDDAREDRELPGAAAKLESSAEPAPPPSDDDQLQAVIVTGERVRVQQSLETKRSAVGVVDAISAEDIGKVPEKNVAQSNQPSVGFAGAPLSQPGEYYQEEGRDRFRHAEVNPVHRVATDPVSTFSADVDTASYSFVRGRLNAGSLPQKDAVRAEEMINYFDYAWPAANSRRVPFRPTVAVSDSPWSKGKKLVHIGIKGYELASEDAPDANLVLLLDVSGSMNSPDKLPLAVRSMELLLDSLKPGDTVGIVVYAGAAGTVLEPTPARDKEKIIRALRSLRPGGSTAGAAGIELAYQLAEAHFRKGGVNRILLATDGDFNVGIDGTEELKGFVERKREKGVYLSVLGFGQGNYRDELAQALAQNGNGVAAYIDSENEARKVLVQEASGSLFTIAKDVKLQVEFNPATVSEYRLVGYETRALKREDFNNDAVDAGDVGAGHTVTAIYEITPVDAETKSVDEPRYPENKAAEAKSSRGSRDEFGFLKIRYKLPNEDKSQLITEPIPLRSRSLPPDVARDVGFSTAVAGFAQLLRGNGYTGALRYEDVMRQAEASRGEDRNGYRGEFITLVRKAQSLR